MHNLLYIHYFQGLLIIFIITIAIFHKLLGKLSYLFHGLGHDLRPGLLREDLEHGEEGEGERLELLELLEVTEELHRDGGSQHQQAHREHDQAPQLAAGAEDLK